MKYDKKNIAVLLFLSLSIAGCLTLEQPVIGHDRNPPSQDVAYKLSIVTFGITKDVKLSRYLNGVSGKADRLWSFWLIEGDGKKIVVDPGVGTEEYAERQNIQNYVRPDMALEKSGIPASEITHVLLTHFHAHSIEAVNLFPNATFYIQSGAFEWARMRVMRGEEKKRGISVPSISFLEQKEREGRLVRMDTTFELFKGLKVHAHYLHTRWYCYFSVNTKDGVYVLPGIIVPYWRNIEENIRCPECNEKVSIRTYETMRVLTGGKVKQIIPAVDPKIIDEFRKSGSHILEVTKQ